MYLVRKINGSKAVNCFIKSQRDLWWVEYSEECTKRSFVMSGAVVIKPSTHKMCLWHNKKCNWYLIGV